MPPTGIDDHKGHRSARPVPASAGRFPRTLRRLRWPVLIAWVLVLVFLYPLARGLSGATNGTAAANLPASASSTRVVQLEQAPGQPDVDAATVVFARSSGLTAADLQAVAAARSAVERLAGHVPGLGDPGRAQRSADGQADAFTADVTAAALQPDQHRHRRRAGHPASGPCQ